MDLSGPKGAPTQSHGVCPAPGTPGSVTGALEEEGQGERKSPLPAGPGAGEERAGSAPGGGAEAGEGEGPATIALLFGTVGFRAGGRRRRTPTGPWHLATHLLLLNPVRAGRSVGGGELTRYGN